MNPTYLIQLLHKHLPPLKSMYSVTGAKRINGLPVYLSQSVFYNYSNSLLVEHLCDLPVGKVDVRDVLRGVMSSTVTTTWNLLLTHYPVDHRISLSYEPEA